MMKRVLSLLAFFYLTVQMVNGQGTVRGKITDENGEPLTGATVSFKEKPTIGTVADYDGKFTIKIPEASPFTLVVSFISYQTVEETVTVKKGEIIVKNYTLVPAATNLDDVVITAKVNRAKDTYMELVKSSSAISLDYISAETIKRTGDSRVDDAVKRITGVSTVGNFITVRGIGDRYVKTTLNGSRIPTLDPFTNNIKLDMFPTNLVDNIVITKTASPNLAGDWTGAFLSIETKDYPDKLSISFTTTFNYNTQSSFQNVVSSQRGPTEWLGFDNGFRDIVHFEKQDFPGLKDPTFYDEFSTIDLLHQQSLIEYLSAYGFNRSNSYQNETFFRLGLVELGLLAPGLIDDEAAVATSTDLYNTQYNHETFEYENADVVEFGKSMANNWETTERKAPIDFSQEATIGNQIQLFNRPLGFIVGLRYAKLLRYDPHAKGIPSVYQGVDAQHPEVDNWYEERSSSEIHAWSALLNLAYSFTPNHNVTFLVMPNFAGNNDVRFTHNYNDEILSDPVLVSDVQEQQKYEERKQMVYQISTEHFVPSAKLRINFNASYTDGSSNTPDFKNVRYYTDIENNLSLPQSYRPDRYFRYLREKLFDSYINFEMPLGDKPGLTRKLSFGAAYQYNRRENDQYLYRLNGIEGQITNNSISDHFDLDRFVIEDGTMQIYYERPESPVDFGFGYSKIAGAYVMLDYNLNQRIRLAGGLRVEHTDIFADVKEFYEMGLPPNDSIRVAYSSFSTGGGSIKVPSLNASTVDQYHYLPSVNLVVKLKNDELAPVNLRMNFSQTIARPSIREVSPFYMYDYSLRSFIVGNPDLKVVSVFNYDIRIESYFTNGDNASVSLFYKSFTNHIELLQGSYYTWQNAEDSRAYGIELEGKKVLTKNLELMANITLVSSRTKEKATAEYTTEYRPMYGQSPYVVNAILSYISDRYKFSTALTYNIQGPKLISVLEAGLPNIYEIPRHVLDLKIAKGLGKHFGLTFKVRNMLNSPVRRSYDYQNWSWDYQYYSTGTDFSLGISYNL